MHALVTGATGFVGRELVRHLEGPVVLSRDSGSARRMLGVAAADWNPAEEQPPSEIFDRIDTVFHLAGEPVGEGRWGREKKDRIRSSRVEGTRNLVDRLVRLPKPPGTLVSASAVGYYGSRGSVLLEEGSDVADSFLGTVSEDWEREALRAEGAGIRVVTVRIGIVLGRDGGALASMLPLFKIGLGGRLGSGQQWMSWIHRHDLVQLMLHIASDSRIRGPVNGVSPNPVRNGEFTRVLSAAVGRPAIFPVPAFALRMALGEFATVLLASQRVVPRVAIDASFEFRYPTLKAALKEVLPSGSGASGVEDGRVA